MENFLLTSPTFCDLAEPNFELKKFPDGENYAWIPQPEELAGRRAVVFHRLFPDQDSRIFQLMQVLSVLKPLAKEIYAVVPYLPYARQDVVERNGEAFSAQNAATLDAGPTPITKWLKEGATCFNLRIDNLYPYQ